MFTQDYWQSKYPRKKNESVFTWRERIYSKRLSYCAYQLGVLPEKGCRNEEIMLLILEALTEYRVNSK